MKKEKFASSQENKFLNQIRILSDPGMLDSLIRVDYRDPSLEEIIYKIQGRISVEDLSVITPGDIIRHINYAFPIDYRATLAVRKFRESSEISLLLGDYFLPGEDYPYMAVCIHKALLGQAVSSMYGISSRIIDFGFHGQLKNGEWDSKGGMHAALLFEDRKGNTFIGDSHKGLYLFKSEYLSMFLNPQVFFDDLVVFSPQTN
jgi:hypothetical protein